MKCRYLQVFRPKSAGKRWLDSGGMAASVPTPAKGDAASQRRRPADQPPSLHSSRGQGPMLIYACRRGLRDRPARNCHCVRVGSGDCGGRMRDEACPGRVAGRGMRPRAVAAGAPDGDRMRAWARLRNSVSFRSMSRILPLKPSSETFHEATSHEAMPHVGLQGPVSRHSTPWPAHRFRVSPDVGSVPLLRKAIRGIAFRSSPIRHDHPGLPRRSISAASHRATHRPEMDVSGIAARHPRVTPSTRFSTRKRHPQAGRP